MLRFPRHPLHLVNPGGCVEHGVGAAQCASMKLHPKAQKLPRQVQKILVRNGLRRGHQVAKSAARVPLLTQSELERSEFKAMLGLGERLGTALLKRGLLVTGSPHGKLRFGVPQNALRFYFPRLWPEAEADVRS